MYTVCSLELPALEPYAFVVVSTVNKECVPTVPRGGARCHLTRKHVIPFRDSKVGMSYLLSSTKLGYRFQIHRGEPEEGYCLG